METLKIYSDVQLLITFYLIKQFHQRFALFSIKTLKLEKESQKKLLEKLKKGIVYFSFNENICGVELAGMQLFRK